MLNQRVLKRLQYYGQLIRIDKPIGTLLLMWPMLMALWVAGAGSPSYKNIIIFVLGCFLMRSAGCAINDFADRKIDALITRTRNRPLAQGLIHPIEALLVFFVCIFLAFLLVYQTNALTIQWSVFAFILAAFYPFVKRFSYYPQCILGAAFACAVPMAFAAQINTVPIYAGYLYLATLLWAIAYDTEYAMVDRADDMKAGVKSLAILLGRWDRLGIFMAQISMVFFLLCFGYAASLKYIYYGSIVFAFVLMVYQQWLIASRAEQACFKAFLNNNMVGLFLFLGVFLSYY